ncbi:hypothetical protein SUDANB132_04698 [Streptomyces sp. enrichment culture]
MTVRSSRNGCLAAGASTGFGFTANGGNTPPPQVGACTAS